MLNILRKGKVKVEEKVTEVLKEIGSCLEDQCESVKTVLEVKVDEESEEEERKKREEKTKKQNALSRSPGLNGIQY